MRPEFKSALFSKREEGVAYSPLEIYLRELVQQEIKRYFDMQFQEEMERAIVERRKEYERERDSPEEIEKRREHEERVEARIARRASSKQD